MNLWLLKEEPTHYSFADLERDGQTTWTGVTNALALKHLRQCVAGDRAFFYHTGKEKCIVGIIEITAPKKPQDPAIKDVSITVRPLKRLKQPVTLSQVKGDKSLASWYLAKMPRLSVMPVTEGQWQRVLELSAKPT
jgi:predicted RNA-binding protein with PUA-like domain